MNAQTYWLLQLLAFAVGHDAARYPDSMAALLMRTWELIE